jgi:hypothetical protein
MTTTRNLMPADSPASAAIPSDGSSAVPAQSIDDPVVAAQLLVDLISSHRRGDVGDAAYAEGFDMLQGCLCAPTAAPSE